MDILIKNAEIIDGTGKGRFKGDIGIEKDKISYIGNKKNQKAKKTIDAGNKVVCPGFIDIHSHADLAIYRKDHNDIYEPLIRQGITTFIGGNCGMGLAPIDTNNFYHYQKLYIEMFINLNFDNIRSWESMDDYMNLLSDQGIALNMGLLVPHGLIRIAAVGTDQKKTSGDNFKKMVFVLEKSLKEGAFGLSAGLQYFPGLHSDTEELVELGKVLAKHDARFFCHLRSYTASTISRAINEVVEVAKKNDIHGQISHMYDVPYIGLFQKPFFSMVRFLSSHPEFANKIMPDSIVSGDMKKVVKILDKCKKDSIRLGMDAMPSNTGFTHLLAFFPPWVLTGSKEEILNRLSDRRTRKKIFRDIIMWKPEWPHLDGRTYSLNIFKELGFKSLRIMAVSSEKNKHLEGQSIFEISKISGKSEFDTTCDLLLEEGGKVLVYMSPGIPEDTFTERSQFPALLHPDVSIVTDTIMMGYGMPHYLFYGCYPKFLGYYVRDKKLLSLEEAVRKSTSLPASQIGIKNRGVIKKNNFADLVIFDPDKIGTRSTFNEPDVFADGIDYVLINGKITLEKGKYNKKQHAGSILRRQ